MDSIHYYAQARQQELRDDSAVRRYARAHRRPRRGPRLPIRMTLVIEWAPPARPA